ncbi:MAG: 5-formyltetrahydrofolate cyclo-ligase [Cyclobacteriaceae bacterium]|nr:5-formyltetrahydrofolate cyclo-ligase [Cyclobacteriaceae bacterium]
MLKHELRKLFMARRSELEEEDFKHLNEKIFLEFQRTFPEDARTVHIFLPILKKKEIDTWPIIRWLWEKDCSVVVPEMDAFNHLLVSRLISPDTKLLANSWGVPQPVDAEQVDDAAIDLVVLPLLAFDVRGYRVGYGSGYYDRFLASLQHSPGKVGLSFFPPVQEISDVHTNDIRMDACIMPGTHVIFS